MAARCEIINPGCEACAAGITGQALLQKTWCECLLRTEIRGNRYGKSVFFDLDDTLYDYTTADILAKEAVREYCQQNLSISGAVYDRQLAKSVCCGRRSGSEENVRQCIIV